VGEEEGKKEGRIDKEKEGKREKKANERKRREIGERLKGMVNKRYETKMFLSGRGKLVHSTVSTQGAASN
jgi:hypothetical protein